MNNYLTEFLGTFFLLLLICFANVNAPVGFAPMVIGLGLIALVHMGAPISKAHYNPAVTLGVLMRGSMDRAEALAYIISQLLGALLAAFVFYQLSGSAMPIGPAPEYKDYHIVKPIVMEGIFTFLLVFVILVVGFSKKTAGNSYYGLSIGMAVLVGAYAAGPVSGGALNPAVGIGLGLVDAIDGANGTNSQVRIWWYLAGPFAGAALASMAYRITNPDEF